jgi:glutaconyl-CoA/methylmalonyl-CoA decarboxylase subunit delta
MTLAIIAQATAAALDSISKARITQNSNRFTEIDPWGVGMTFIGMSVVFLSLILLYLLFMNISRVIVNKTSKAEVKKEETGEHKKVTKNIKLEDEVNAAISLALHLYITELHDRESTVLTINRVARTYSPWSSKIYGIRQFPR